MIYEWNQGVRFVLIADYKGYFINSGMFIFLKLKIKFKSAPMSLAMFSTLNLNPQVVSQ